VTVILLINGTPAFYGGAVVAVSLNLAGGGGTAFVTLTWQAPVKSTYSLTVQILGGGDTNPPNNVFGTSILAALTSFT
jgi:hypothetical protein